MEQHHQQTPQSLVKSEEVSWPSESDSPPSGAAVQAQRHQQQQQGGAPAAMPPQHQHVTAESYSASMLEAAAAAAAAAANEHQHQSVDAVAAAEHAAAAAAAAAHHQHQQDIYNLAAHSSAKLRVHSPSEAAAAQQAAAVYGHVQQLHPNAATAHYISQAAAAAAAARGLAYGHPGQATAGGADMRGGYAVAPDGMSSQKAVAFLAGPRERIHVFGNPVECCPRCQQEGFGNVQWRPHRHIGELKIRYICERNFEDLESNHHFDIPLCPVCGQVLYLYEFNGMLGVSSARRLHKYVLKCANRHVLPLIDLFCQTKRGGERCNSNFKLQWSYGTMVKRCETQKNRDHDLWWVRYKNEWKQRRTIIRYKKDFLRHLSDVQRALLLGLGLEGEAPPDPKTALGPTYDALVATAGGSPAGPKIKKRQAERGAGSVMSTHVSSLSSPEEYDFQDPVVKRQHREPQVDVSQSVVYMGQHLGSDAASSPDVSAASGSGVQGSSNAAATLQALPSSAFHHMLSAHSQQQLAALQQMGYAKHYAQAMQQAAAAAGAYQELRTSWEAERMEPQMSTAIEAEGRLTTLDSDRG